MKLKKQVMKSIQKATELDTLCLNNTIKKSLLVNINTNC